MVSFLGSGFLIGSRGYALSASHVVQVLVPPEHAIVGLFANTTTNKWSIFNADTCEHHATEDVALLKMRSDAWEGFGLKISFAKQFASLQYRLFGYPSANLYENVNDTDSSGAVLGRPDLIFSAGHVRRRVSFALPAVRGTSFYELSQPVGPGCSGSPIIWQIGTEWVVIGIYVADKTVHVPFETFDKELNVVIRTVEVPGALAYAVRMDALVGWNPVVLGANLQSA